MAWNDVKAPEGTPKTWDEWTDILGQTYRPGDWVAVATVNMKSPQLVVGQVLKINRIDSKGNLVGYEEWDTPTGQWYDFKGPRPGLRWKESCTVTVAPMIDARGFHRSSPDKKSKNVTYTIANNVIKVPEPRMEQG